MLEGKLIDQLSTFPWGLLLPFLLVVIALARWIGRREAFISAVEKLPGPLLKNSHPWLSGLQVIMETVGTIPGHPQDARAADVIQRWLDEFSNEGLCRIWYFHPWKVPFATANVFVSDPEIFRQLEKEPKNSHKLVKEPRIYNLSAPLVGNSLLMLPNCPKWKHERKVSASAFRQAFLEYTNQIIADLLHQKLFPKWGQRKTIELQESMTRLAAEVLGLAAFSYSFGSLETQQNQEQSLYETFQVLLNTISRRCRSAPGVQYLPTLENYNFVQKSRHLNSIIWSILRERQRSTNHEQQSDLLSYLMKAENEMATKDIFGNVRMFLFAGHDTTSGTITGALWELATHPKEQRRLQQEVDTLFDLKGSTPSYKDLMQLPYLDAVVKEIMRMYSGAGLARETQEDVKVSGSNGNKYIIPKGCAVFYFPAITSRLERYFDRPDEFDPDRFMHDERGENAAGNPAYTPFSVGPRSCVGQPMAIAEVKAVLAHVMRHYSLSRNPDAGEPVRILQLTIKLFDAIVDAQRRR